MFLSRWEQEKKDEIWLSPMTKVPEPTEKSKKQRDIKDNDCIKFASQEYIKMLARRGAQFVPIGMPTACWKTFPAKTTKMLSTRNSSILMMSSSKYLLFFLESECPFTKYVSSCHNTKYLYHFENEGVSDNTGESVFQFLVRYGCIKIGKIKGLDAC